MRFILLHSPLTGAAAWAPLAAALAERGVESTRPVIPPLLALAAPLYESAARAVAAQVLSQEGPFVLAVHSAAGGLAPAVVEQPSGTIHHRPGLSGSPAAQPALAAAPVKDR